MGFQLSSGHYIQWLDADDLLEPQKIQNQVLYLESHPDVDVVYGDWKEWHFSKQTGEYIESRRSFSLDNFLLEYTQGKWVALHSFLMRRSLAQRYAWDTTLPVLEDHDYWFQHALRGAVFHYLPDSDCAIYRIRGEGNNRNRMRRKWLEGRSLLQRKMAWSLDMAGYLAQKPYRLALAGAYMGLAWRCYLDNCREVGNPAISEAERLIGGTPLSELKWPQPPLPLLGLRRSLLLYLYRKRIKESFKRVLFQLLGFDHKRTWRANVKIRIHRLSSFLK
jgi:hypothetical protein